MQAQIHRFRERVAMHTPKAPTCYLSPDEARALGAALIAGANEISQGVRFTESRVGTVYVDLPADCLQSATANDA